MTHDSDLPLKERILCTGCLTSNEPDANFCVSCGGPLTSYAATGPLESIYARGHVLRAASDHPRSLLVVIGIWVLFLPPLLYGVLGLIQGDWLSGVIFALFSATLIFKTTRNYIRAKTAE